MTRTLGGSMRRTTALTAAAAVLALAGCSKSEPTVNTAPASNVPPAAGSTTAAAPAKTSTTSAAPKKAKLGDTVTIKTRNTDLAVTLVKIVDPAKGADEFMNPAAGHHYVAVQIRIVNNGQAVYSDDPAVDVKAKNAAGETMSTAFTTTTAGADMPTSVDLTPGDTALGFVDFEVPDGQKITQVQYAVAMVGGDGVAQWTLS